MPGSLRTNPASLRAMANTTSFSMTPPGPMAPVSSRTTRASWCGSAATWSRSGPTWSTVCSEASPTGLFGESKPFLELEVDDHTAEAGIVAGPVILGGVRVPVGRRSAIGGEIRYQAGSADIGTDFYGDKLDLGGMTYTFTMTFRF